MATSKTDTCKFISGHVAQLALLAIAADMKPLAYLLEMARLEADTEAIAAIKSTRALGHRRNRKEQRESLVAFAP